MAIRRVRNRKTLGPIVIMMILSFVIMILSFIFSKLGLQAVLTEVGTSETTIVTVNNIFSREGIQYIFGEAVSNFKNIAPLIYVAISLIAVSILEASGLLKHIFSVFKGIKPSIITFLVLFLSIISTLALDYGYAVLIPLVAVLYKNLNRDPKVGIMTVFLGITAGYGAGFLYNYEDIALGALTKQSAIGIINDYSFDRWSMSFITTVSTLILSIVGTMAVEKFFPKKTKKFENEELIVSTKALKATAIVFGVMLLTAIYAIIPGLPLSGFLLSPEKVGYMDKLFAPTSPFREGILVLFVFVSLVCGYVYGNVSRNIKNTREYNSAIADAFKGTGFIFAGLFFASIMLGILEWTNISTVLSLKIINLFNNVKMTGVFLIMLMFIVFVLVTMLNPTTISNWTLISPIFVPLAIRANISPAFAQMIFKAADSIGKCITPFYVYLIVMLGFLYKYDNDGEELELFGTMRKMLPAVLWMAMAWIIIIIGWNLLGLNIGINTYPTL